MTFAQKFFQSVAGNDAKKKRIFFNALGLSVFSLLMVVYLWQINAGVNNCLKIEEMGNRLESLKKENEELIKKTSTLGSMTNVYELVQSLKMVKIDQIDYLFATQERFALK